VTIRFLQTVESGNPEFPFQPGQVIHVDDPTPFLKLLDGVRAVAVQDTEPEYATVRAPRMFPKRKATRSVQ
jgi:hypothetical protein